MKKGVVLLLAGLIFFSLVLSISSVSALDKALEGNKVTIYLFWGEGCPHCADEKPFLDSLQQRYPELEVKSYETWYNPENAKLFSDMAKAFGTTAMGVPTTFLDDKVWVGYADYMGKEIEDKVKYCIEQSCTNPLQKLENPSVAEISESQETVSHLEAICIHIFLHGECPQCDAVSPYLDSLAEKYNIDLTKHDVSIPEEKELYDKFKETYSLIDGGFPALFIGNRFLLGETAIKQNIEQEIISCSEKGCICPAEKIQGLTPYPPQPKDITPEKQGVINIPIFGEIDTAKLSLPFLTIILAGVDSFNPCAFFVLFFLLSMLIYAKSRKRMLLIGGTFVFFSALIYFLFMAAWLNLFLLIGQLMIITAIAGIVALIVAAINIKDFFFFEKGISLVIPEKAKPKLFERMRNLLKASSIPSMMLGTIILAIAANSYELLCTAGFPMVFTRVLTLNSLSMAQYYSYLAFYNIIYVIPLMSIVLIFVVSLGAKKLTEWQGQVLKLVSGMMMLCLGLVLLIKPALMNNMLVSLGLVAIALTSAGIIILITKKIKKREESGIEEESIKNKDNNKLKERRRKND
jgi:thiol-disulfide isomerase/thioredoxin